MQIKISYEAAQSYRWPLFWRFSENKQNKVNLFASFSFRPRQHCFRYSFKYIFFPQFERISLSKKNAVISTNTLENIKNTICMWIKGANVEKKNV